MENEEEWKEAYTYFRVFWNTGLYEVCRFQWFIICLECLGMPLLNQYNMFREQDANDHKWLRITISMIMFFEQPVSNIGFFVDKYFLGQILSKKTRMNIWVYCEILLNYILYGYTLYMLFNFESKEAKFQKIKVVFTNYFRMLFLNSSAYNSLSLDLKLVNLCAIRHLLYECNGNKSVTFQVGIIQNIVYNMIKSFVKLIFNGLFDFSITEVVYGIYDSITSCLFQKDKVRSQKDKPIKRNGKECSSVTIMSFDQLTSQYKNLTMECAFCLGDFKSKKNGVYFYKAFGILQEVLTVNDKMSDSEYTMTNMKLKVKQHLDNLNSISNSQTDMIALLGCHPQHFFHKGCLYDFAKKQPTVEHNCPLCRQPFAIDKKSFRKRQ